MKPTETVSSTAFKSTGKQLQLQVEETLQKEELQTCSKFANTLKALFGLPGCTNRNMKQRDGLPGEINYIAHLVYGVVEVEGVLVVVAEKETETETGRKNGAAVNVDEQTSTGNDI